MMRGGGRPPKFTLAQRREIKKIAKAKPAEYDLPFSTWSLARLADFVVAEGVTRGVDRAGSALPGRHCGGQGGPHRFHRPGMAGHQLDLRNRLVQQYGETADHRAPGGQG